MKHNPQKCMNTPTHSRGFTLIEILIAIGIITILAAVVLVAVNPARQFAKAHDAQRSANLNALLNAITQYMIDQKGTLPASISSSVQSIGSGGADLCTLLVPDYLSALPQDPKNNGGVQITECGNYTTGYTVQKDEKNRVIVTAPQTEIGDPISLTR
jgi:prepilin-type N-terminal cleavage/methylation domain-containing protein